VKQLDQLLLEAERALAEPSLQAVLGRRRQALESIRRELGNPRLRLGIIGVTSSGKSTFVNALLGERLLPEQSKPTSNVLVYARRGPRRRMVATFLDGRPAMELTDTAVTSRALADLTAEDHNPGNVKKVARVELELPGMLLEPSFEVVDTPGLDAYGLEWHQQVTLDEFVPQADVIIYMTSIRNPFKLTDFDALDSVVEHDQRVLFVMSGKDMEVDDLEANQVIATREDKLRRHLERLKRDSAHRRGLKTAGHVLVDSKLALESRRDDSAQWAWSGFPEVLSILNGFSRELLALMAESRAKRARLHVGEALSQVQLLLAQMAGNTDESEKIRAERAQKVGSLHTALSQAQAAIRAVMCSHSVDDVLAPARRAGLSESDSTRRFDEVLLACDQVLASAHGAIRTRVSTAKQQLERIVNGCGLSAPRDPIADVALDSLPAAPVKEGSRKETYEVEVGWGWRWPPWPHTETRTRTVYYRDVSVFVSALENRARVGLNRLSAHAQGVRQTLTSRYVTVLQGELDKLKSEQRAADQTLDSLRSQVATLDGSRRTLEQVQRVLSGEQAAVSRQSVVPVAVQSEGTAPDPRRHARTTSVWRGLLPVLSSFRELRFHKRFLRTFDQVVSMKVQGGRPYRVAILGLDLQDRQHLVNLLLHRLHDPVALKISPGEPVLLGAEGIVGGNVRRSRSVAASRFKGLAGVYGEFLRKASLLVAENDQGSGWTTQLAEQVINWADICLVLVDGPRIGSGISDLQKARYKEVLVRHADKVIYVVPHGAKFNDRLADLATEVAPDLMKRGPYGRRPLIVYENYDERYTDCIQLIQEAASPQEFRRRWRAEGIATGPPFTPDRLELIYEAVRAATD
jgi:predicted GTPase